jgi:arsenate reductase
MKQILFCAPATRADRFSEATFNHLAPRAGARDEPAAARSVWCIPRALALLQREGIPTDGLSSKSWTTCRRRRTLSSLCAAMPPTRRARRPGPVQRDHWGVDDPAKATGTDAEITAAFQKAYDLLRAH